MNHIKQRRYNQERDENLVFKFLQESYDFKTLNSYLLPHYFEYALYHSMADNENRDRIGLWEDSGDLVAIAFYEFELGQVHLHTQTNYEELFGDLLKWSEKELVKSSEDVNQLEVWTTNAEKGKEDFLTQQGYEKVYTYDVTIFDYKNLFLERKLPEGFTLIDGTSVDYTELAKCYHYGFNNEREMSIEDIEGCKKLHQTPHADQSLTRIVVAPNGEYACALGAWFDDLNQYLYLEPLATIPKYRRLGLATIALMDVMKESKVRGACYCFGGGTQDFYPSIGFEHTHTRHLWRKNFN